MRELKGEKGWERGMEGEGGSRKEIKGGKGWEREGGRAGNRKGVRD